MTTHEQVKQRLKEYEEELKGWEDRLITAIKPVQDEVELCNRMIRHCKKSIRIYEKSFPHNGNQTGPSTVASNSTAGQVY